MSSLLGKFVLKQNPDLRHARCVATLAAGGRASVSSTAYAGDPLATPVDEDIVTGGAQSERSDVRRSTPEAMAQAAARTCRSSAGSFNGESGHRGEGEANGDRARQGRARRATFSSFDVDPGAGDLRVYLHQGKSTSDDLGEFVEIAELKGNKGDQQYEIPAKVDLERYNSVVIWCVPFSTTELHKRPLS